MYINLDRRSTLLKIPSVPLQKSEFTIFPSLILIRKEGDEYVDRLVAKERKETEEGEERGAMIAA